MFSDFDKMLVTTDEWILSNFLLRFKWEMDSNWLGAYFGTNMLQFRHYFDITQLQILNLDNILTKLQILNLKCSTLLIKNFERILNSNLLFQIQDFGYIQFLRCNFDRFILFSKGAKRKREINYPCDQTWTTTE